MGTFIACLLLPLEIGILTGIGINLLFILYHAARPKITVEVLKVSNNTFEEARVAQLIPILQLDNCGTAIYFTE